MLPKSNIWHLFKTHMWFSQKYHFEKLIKITIMKLKTSHRNLLDQKSKLKELMFLSDTEVLSYIKEWFPINRFPKWGQCKSTLISDLAGIYLYLFSFEKKKKKKKTLEHNLSLADLFRIFSFLVSKGILKSDTFAILMNTLYFALCYITQSWEEITLLFQEQVPFKL